MWSQVAQVTRQELQSALSDLSRQGLFRAGDFAYPLFREVALNMVGAERKRDLARRALEVLKDEPERAALFVAAAGLEPGQTLTILKDAAEHGQERSEVAAAKFLAKAVTYAVGEEKGRLALRAAEKLAPSNLLEATRLAEIAWNIQPQDETSVYFLAELYARQERLEDIERVLATLSSERRDGLAYSVPNPSFRVDLTCRE